MIIIGIDPGLTGALAAIDGRQLLYVGDLPTVPVAWAKKTRQELSAALLFFKVMSLLKEYGPAECAAIEEVSASPQMGATSAFRFGEVYATTKAVCACAGLRIEPVRPAVWKRTFGLSKEKDASRALAIRLWPDSADMFARKKDDGRAEAALLAEYINRRK